MYKINVGQNTNSPYTAARTKWLNHSKRTAV